MPKSDKSSKKIFMTHKNEEVEEMATNIKITKSGETIFSKQVRYIPSDYLYEEDIFEPESEVLENIMVMYI